MSILLLTSGAVLALTCAAFFAYEFFAFRRDAVRELTTLSQIIAGNSTAALAFVNRDDARETLGALRAERHITAACLYDADGKLFAAYPAELTIADFPSGPGSEGFRFEQSQLAGFQPVVLGDGTKRLGTIYLRSDTGAMAERFRLYGIVAVAVIAMAFLAAYLLSRMLQRQISQPVLALAEAARAVSEGRDYSVRAARLGGDEFGLMTDAFNHMLAQIQAQNLSLSESATRVRAVLDSAQSAVLVMDANGLVTDWNARAADMFGWSRSEALGQELAGLVIPPQFRDAHRRGMKHFLATGEGAMLNRAVEMSALRRDGTEFPIELSISVLKSGDAVSFCGFITDITERKREDEVRARFAAIVESSDDAIVSKSTTGIITSWNHGAEKIFGYSAAEAISRPMMMLIPPDRAHEETDILTRIARGDNVEHFETVRRCKDGKLIDMSVTVSPLRDRTGRVIGASTIARDITERRRADEALRSSQQMLEAVVENSVAIIYVKDAAGRYLLINRRFEEVFRVTRASAVGKTDHDLFSKDVADALRRTDQQVLQTRAVLQVEEVAPLADGTHTYVSVKCPLLDASGQPYAMCGISTDITDRKRSEDRLRTQLVRIELLNRITRAIGERQDLPSIFQVVVRSLENDLPIDFGCICLYDAAKERLTVTSVGAKSQGLARELAMGEQAEIAIDENGLSRCVRGQLVYEPDISALPFPFPKRVAAGNLRALVAAPLIVESQVFGVLIAARFPTGSFSSAECEFLRQLSEHVALAAHQAQLYSALQKAYDELRETQHNVMQQERLRVLGQMASGIAHDINNAISPVALYTESLLEKETNLSARARDYLGTIQRAIEDVADTVARMREFYRHREAQISLSRVALNRVAHQVVDLTRVRWSNLPQERGIVVDLRTELAENLPDIMGAESEIRDALTNLIFNAVDAMPQGGTLTLRTRALGGNRRPVDGKPAEFVSFEVSDSGVGMSEETRRRCLEPFFTTKGERGTGLGLAMVYGMVQRHSADIEIESETGKGTTVRLIFAVPTAAAAAQTASGPAPRPARRLRLLVVDDDPLLIRSLRDTLENDGHFVIATDGGQAGIDAFVATQATNARFDAVITDLGMPYVDGRKVAAAIKAASPTTPVILLTGWGQRLVAEGDVPAHVDRVLNKPPKLQELRATLAELTAGS